MSLQVPGEARDTSFIRMGRPIRIPNFLKFPHNLYNAATSLQDPRWTFKATGSFVKKMLRHSSEEPTSKCQRR